MDPDAASDQELLDAIAAGPPDADPAFATLYRRHKDWCWRIARRLSNNDTLAEDVVHDAFMALLARAGDLQLRGKLTTYLYPIIRHRLIDAARKRSRRPEPRRPSATPDTTTEDRRAVRTAVMALPESQREILLLRLVDGLSVAEVALALEIPEGTVKSRLHAAVAALRRDATLASHFDAEKS